MRRRLPWTFLAVAAALAAGSLILTGATFTEPDSTQPRGSPATGVNAPVVDGFRAPARFSAYTDWSGSIMANAMRDPAFLAELNDSNHNFIEFVNNMAKNAPAEFTNFLTRVGLDPVLDQIAIDPLTGRLTNEDKLPVTADLCLRCHTPVGWLEGRSEPPTSHSPFLRGQFWGAAFREIDASFNVNSPTDSETDMEGVTCDFCHRANNNFKRASRFDGSVMAAGNGGFFVDKRNPFGSANAGPQLVHPFQESATFCGTCHDVTNPLLKTNTPAGPGGTVPDMLHPIERTYTEWFWSSFRTESRECQSCHEPMKFHGAQTWLLTGLDRLWGDVDRKWTDKGFDVNPTRREAFGIARQRNTSFMAQKAASLDVYSRVRNGMAEITAKVTNNTGHRLPTGFGEGRQMWLHVRATDANGVVLFEDGAIDQNPASPTFGQLVRRETPDANGNLTKVYEHVAIVKPKAGEEPFYSHLDASGNGQIEGDEGHFNFVLMNYVKKDNRIPPKGFNREAYMADGAFIVPTNLYANGENWDFTTYKFPVPFGTTRVDVTLYYQTFSKEYVDFLAEHDKEETTDNQRLDENGVPEVDENGAPIFGRARPIPSNGAYANKEYWGEVIQSIWQDTGNGPAVRMGSRSITIRR